MSIKTYCNFCETEMAKEKKVAKLVTLEEKKQFNVTALGDLPQEFKSAVERQEYDLCEECLKKVFKAVEK